MEANKIGPYKIGQKYFIRTVTMAWTGELLGVWEHELLIKDAAWIADSGRFSEAIKFGVLSEVEPVEHEVIIGRGAIVDICEWHHELPREVK